MGSLLFGYEVVEHIYQGRTANVYLGTKQGQAGSFVLKIMRKEFPSLLDISRFQHEYAIMKRLDSPYFPKAYDFIREGNQYGIIMEDIGAKDLQQLPSGPLTLDVVLNLAVHAASALVDLSMTGLVHKDINPTNLIFNKDDNRMQIIDFGLSAELAQEKCLLQSAHCFEGSLPYISPEQTGRTNDTIDYRSDLYSFGVTLYWLLTRTLPFESDDPMGWFHVHIAQAPVPVHKKKPGVPRPLSDIVSKLMHKSKENRYQNVLSLQQDLQNCQEQWSSRRRIDDFQIGERDISSRFLISQKLYGRQAEVAELMESFARVARGRQRSGLVLVAGHSGIGKTCLISLLYRPLLADRGYFVRGKHEQFKNNLPFLGVSQSLRDLTTQILMESKERQQAWKEKIFRALAEETQLIVELVPELESLVGQLPAVPKLEGLAEIRRLQRLINRFLQVFAQKEHPLVVFLDDLQWADLDSFALMANILQNSDTSYLLIMGAYRSNEVDPSHPLIKMVKGLEEDGVNVSTLQLPPLRKEHVSQLVGDTIADHETRSQQLAELVVCKTEGNPFFINQFLQKLHSDGLFVFDYQEGRWKWDLTQIEVYDVTPNIVDLMLRRLQTEYSEPTQRLLGAASCLGNTFALSDLAKLINQPLRQLVEEIWPAFDSGCVRGDGEKLKLLRGMGMAADDAASSVFALSADEDVILSFLHDQIQNGASKLLSDEEKQVLHLKIARKMMQESEEDDFEQVSFDLAHHYNQAYPLIQELQEQFKVIQINLRCGEEAISATAYSSAIDFLTLAQSYLSANAWQEHHSLAFFVHLVLLKAYALAGQTDRGEAIVAELDQNVVDEQEKLATRHVKVLYYELASNYEKAVEAGVNILNYLGIPLPQVDDDREPFVVEEQQNVASLLAKTDIESLSRTEPMTDAIASSILALNHSILAPAYIACHQNLVAWIMLKNVNLTIKHGTSALAALAYINYGVLVSIQGNYPEAIKFGAVGLEVRKSCSQKGTLGREKFMYHAFIGHYATSFKQNAEGLAEGYSLAVSEGALDMADFCTHVSFLYHSILSLLDTELFFKHHRPNVPEYIEQYTKPAHYFPLCFLTEQSMDTWGIENLTLDEIINFDETKILLNTASWWGATALFLTTLTRNWQSPERIKNYATFMRQAHPGQYHCILAAFYGGLHLAAIYNQQDKITQEEIRKLIAEYLSFLEAAAASCEQNYLAPFSLLRAEQARIEGSEDLESIMNHYELAITTANGHGLLQYEAVATEWYGEFWMARGQSRIAKAYLQQAMFLYRTWGSPLLARNIEQRHHHLLSARDAFHYHASEDEKPLQDDDRSTCKILQKELDLRSIMKASVNISKEYRLEKSLASMIDTLVENAGAEFGYLFLPDKTSGRLFLQAEGNYKTKETHVLQNLPLEEMEVPHGLIQLVAKTKRDVLIDDFAQSEFAGQHGDAGDSPHRSVLCRSILKQKELIGVLFLENRLFRGAFSKKNVVALDILSTQAAISLENAFLYENLEQKVEERTEKLKEARDALWGEMMLAKKIQTALLPQDPTISGYEIAVYMNPADEVGGDYYDVFSVGDKKWMIIGDVSGHGVSAGLIMMMVQTAIHGALSVHPELSPSELLNAINNTLRKNLLRLNESKYMTIYAFLLQEDGRVDYAGLHEDILIYRASTEKTHWVESEGMWLGIMDNIHQILENHTITLEVGDVMLNYTDGFTEAKLRDSDERFGSKRLAAAFQRSAARSPDGIVQELVQSLQNYEQDDDRSVVVMKRVK